MSTNQIIEQKRRCSKKLLTDLPQRVIVHKILISHELVINLKEEKNPFLLFGYFLNDRLRNIWFVFSSIKCCGDEYKFEIEENLIINYSKLCNIHYDEVVVPNNIVYFSHRMYSLISLVISVNFASENIQLTEIVPESFFSESKFSNLKTFSLDIFNKDFPITRDWHECQFFDQLKSLSLDMFASNIDDVGLISFFLAKEKIFGKNMKKLHLESIDLDEKVIISLPNLKILLLLHCKNLFVIPSEKQLKEIRLRLDPSLKEIDQIAFNSRNARSIDIWKCSGKFLPLFEEEEFPNLKKLIILLNSYSVVEKWRFSSLLKELKISSNPNHPDFFQKNKWNELEKLTIEHCHILTKDVKFPNLRFISITGSRGMSDDFFEHFEGEVLEVLVLDLYGRRLTGKRWNKNIFRSLKKLKFRNEFDDSFFQENEFPNLKRMSIRYNDKLKDRSSWREMKSLEEIKVDGCKFLKSWKRE